MILAQSEFCALLAKAGRGAGLPEGLARENARLVRILRDADLPAARIAAKAVLQLADGGSTRGRYIIQGDRLVIEADGPLSAFASGIGMGYWLAGRKGRRIESCVTDQPFWLLAAIAHTTGSTGIGHVLETPNGARIGATFEGKIPSFDQILGDGPIPVTIVQANVAVLLNPRRNAPETVNLDDNLARAVNLLAENTFVEESETSRIRGAG